MEDQEPSVYERIGGAEAVEALVGEFYKRVMADEGLAPFFEHVPMGKLLMMQKEFFSEALGGPLVYSGRSMRDVHAGRGIHKSQLRLFTGHLLDVLNAHQETYGLTSQEIDAIYNRIALEADEISGGGAESG